MAFPIGKNMNTKQFDIRLVFHNNTPKFESEGRYEDAVVIRFGKYLLQDIDMSFFDYYLGIKKSQTASTGQTIQEGQCLWELDIHTGAKVLNENHFYPDELETLHALQRLIPKCEEMIENIKSALVNWQDFDLSEYLQLFSAADKDFDWGISELIFPLRDYFLK